MLKKVHVIEITKACKVAFIKAKNLLVVRCRERHFDWKKEDWKNNFFKALGNRL